MADIFDIRRILHYWDGIWHGMAFAMGGIRDRISGYINQNLSIFK